MTTKHNLLVRFTVLSFACLLFVANVKAYAQDAATQTKAEIQRLQQSLKEQPIQSPDLADLGKGIEQRLKEADSARAAGRLYLSLENLGRAEDYFQAVRTIEAKADAIKDNLPAFEAEWGKASLEYAALDKQAHQRRLGAAFLRRSARLSESAQGRTIPLLEGSRGFATATKPQDGLAYMGEAKGEAAYANFLYGLSIARKGAPFPLRSVLPELEALQEKTNAAFQPPRSIDMHPRFIASMPQLSSLGNWIHPGPMLARFINILKQRGTMACSIRLCLTMRKQSALRSQRGGGAEKSFRIQARRLYRPDFS